MHNFCTEFIKVMFILTFTNKKSLNPKYLLALALMKNYIYTN